MILDEIAPLEPFRHLIMQNHAWWREKMLTLMQERVKMKWTSGIWTEDLWHQSQVSLPYTTDSLENFAEKIKEVIIQGQKAANT